MEIKTKVKFQTKEWKNGVSYEVTLLGTIIDRYSDIVSVEQPMPSGKGGRIDLEHFKMNADFYLVLADNGTTHKIRCREIVFVSPPRDGGN